MLEVHGLSKTYHERTRALADVSFVAPVGIFGLLGPNGAGKSTLLRILATLLEPDAGSARIDGLDLLVEKAEARRKLGYLPQAFGFHPSLTVAEMLGYLVALKGFSGRAQRRDEVDRLLELVNLEGARRMRLRALSGGMAQRLGIAQALAGDPYLILLDEPTVGLDPEERVRLFDVLARLALRAVVVLSTHIISDVISVCDHVAVMRAGAVVEHSTPTEALARLEGAVWEATRPFAAAAELTPGVRTLVAQRLGSAVRVRVYAPEGCPGDGFAPTAPRLEDAYFEAISRQGSGT
jgi:ABC-type multidrug transport system ATPase subunit